MYPDEEVLHQLKSNLQVELATYLIELWQEQNPGTPLPGAYSPLSIALDYKSVSKIAAKLADKAIELIEDRLDHDEETT
jgi:hypothetical protein